MFYEELGDGYQIQPVTRELDDSQGRYNRGFRPHRDRFAGNYSPILNYRYDRRARDTRADGRARRRQLRRRGRDARLRQPAHRRPDAADHRRARAADPPGEHTRAVRDTACRLYSRAGRARHQHHRRRSAWSGRRATRSARRRGRGASTLVASDDAPAVLFSFDDAPIQKPFSLYRRQVAAGRHRPASALTFVGRAQSQSTEATSSAAVWFAEDALWLRAARWSQHAFAGRARVAGEDRLQDAGVNPRHALGDRPRRRRTHVLELGRAQRRQRGAQRAIVRRVAPRAWWKPTASVANCTGSSRAARERSTRSRSAVELRSSVARSAASAAVTGSMASIASNSSSRVRPIRRSWIENASISRSGSLVAMRSPPRAPTRTSIRPRAASALTASRMVTRLTLKRSASSASVPSHSPGLRPVGEEGSQDLGRDVFGGARLAAARAVAVHGLSSELRLGHDERLAASQEVLHQAHKGLGSLAAASWPASNRRT